MCIILCQLKTKQKLDYSVHAITTKIKYTDINKKQIKEFFTIVTNLSSMRLGVYGGEFKLHKHN